MKLPQERIDRVTYYEGIEDQLIDRVCLQWQFEQKFGFEVPQGIRMSQNAQTYVDLARMLKTGVVDEKWLELWEFETMSPGLA